MIEPIDANLMWERHALPACSHQGAGLMGGREKGEVKRSKKQWEEEKEEEGVSGWGKVGSMTGN